MRKLNVKRMQKYVYRSFPDRFEFHVDALAYSNDQIKALYDAALADFMTKMAVKHQGKQIEVVVFQDEWLMHNLNDVVWVFQARPHPRR